MSNASPLTRPAPIGVDVLLVNDREAARLLGGISTRTLWSQTSPRGPIPVVRLGSRVLYSIDSLRAYIAQQTTISAKIEGGPV